MHIKPQHFPDLPQQICSPHIWTVRMRGVVHTAPVFVQSHAAVLQSSTSKYTFDDTLCLLTFTPAVACSFAMLSLWILACWSRFCGCASRYRLAYVLLGFLAKLRLFRRSKLRYLSNTFTSLTESQYQCLEQWWVTRACAGQLQVTEVNTISKEKLIDQSKLHWSELAESPRRWPLGRTVQWRSVQETANASHTGIAFWYEDEV